MLTEHEKQVLEAAKRQLRAAETLNGCGSPYLEPEFRSQYGRIAPYTEDQILITDYLITLLESKEGKNEG